MQTVTDHLKLRLDKLQQNLREGGYDAAAIVPGPTLTYLIGISFHLSKRPLVLFVPATGEPSLIIPLLEMPRVQDKLPFPVRFFTYSDAEGYHSAFGRACQALAGKRIGVEGLSMRVIESELIEEYAARATVDIADNVIGTVRLHKQENELAAMRRAIAISEAALEATISQVRAGMTERAVVNILQREMTEHGGAGNAFEPIVLVGAKSALPHGTPDDTPIREGDLLLFDFGTTFDHYPADITRTFAVGHIDPEFAKIYETVLRANEAAIRLLRPGVIAQDVDRAARKVITDAGYGEYFIHRTGHGLGLDIHEAPNMVEGNTQALEPGMVFTIEPGIYIPGKGGVRIEDNVAITADGVEVLTSFPKALRVIGQ
jgi:Xaa-Pro dipeptidase